MLLLQRLELFELVGSRVGEEEMEAVVCVAIPRGELVRVGDGLNEGRGVLLLRGESDNSGVAAGYGGAGACFPAVG